MTIRRHRLLLVALLPACANVVVSAPVTPAPVTPAPVTPVMVTPTPTPVPAALAACTSARADGTVLIAVAGADVVALDVTGSWRTLDAAAVTTPPAIVTNAVISSDGYLALSRQHRVNSAEAENTYALLAPDGTVRWRRSQTVRYGGSPFTTSIGLQTLYVSPGGAVVANHTSFDTRIHAWAESISPDGTSRWVADAAAVGPIDEAGRVPVEDYPNSATAIRWWSPESGAVAPLGGSERGGAVVAGAFTVAWEVGDAGVSLVSHRGTRVERFALPFANERELSFDGVRDEGWLLVARRDEGRVVHRVDLNRGRAEAITPRYPERFAGAENGRPGIGSDGALMAVLSDGEWAELHRSEDGVEWTRVGRPVTGTLGIELHERGGTYVVRAHNELFGGRLWPEQVRDEPDGLRGASLHIARPSTGRDVVVYAGNAERGFGGGTEVAIAPTGRCVAWVETRDGSSVVEVANMEDGTRHRAPLPRGMMAGRAQWF